MIVPRCYVGLPEGRVYYALWQAKREMATRDAVNPMLERLNKFIQANVDSVLNEN